MSKTVALFADVSNLFYCVNKKFEKRKLDYETLLEKAVGDNTLHRAFAYGTFINNDTIRFIDCLKYLGYEPRFKQPKVHINHHGDKEYWKVNWCIGIAMDVVRLTKKLDIIIIGSSASELVPLVEWIREQGVKVIIMSCRIPNALKNVADQWIDLDESYLEKVNTDE